MNKKLTLSEKRVAVAKDALKQIQAGLYIPSKGDYITDVCRLVGDENLPSNTQVQEFIKNIDEPCELCARGALLISSIRKFNKVTVGDITRNSQYYLERITDIFSNTQLDEMECVFEGWRADSDIIGNKNKAVKFFRKYPDDKIRLVAILKNVIKNKGTFKL